MDDEDGRAYSGDADHRFRAMPITLEERRPIGGVGVEG